MPNKVVYAKEGKPKTWKEGNACPRCYEVLHWVEVSDYRSEEAIRNCPLTEDEKYILGCRCLHPGDYIVGGFF